MAVEREQLDANVLNIGAIPGCAMKFPRLLLPAVTDL